MQQQESSKRYYIEITLRVVLIIIMLFVAYRVVYYKYGYKSFEDQKLLHDIGFGPREAIDCRGALIYYAEHELMIINETKASEVKQEHNISYLEKYLFNSSIR